MTTLFPTIDSDQILAYGEENAVGSVHLWFRNIFGHASGYQLYYDKDNAEFIKRKGITFPNINIVQVDGQDYTNVTFGGKKNRMNLLFYVYFNHHLSANGTRRLLRRGRDQISYALKTAGIMKDNNFIVDPIYLYDFSKSPLEKIGVISVSSGIQQRFTQDGELLQAELVVPMAYIEDLNV